MESAMSWFMCQHDLWRYLISALLPSCIHWVYMHQLLLVMTYQTFKVQKICMPSSPLHVCFYRLKGWLTSICEDACYSVNLIIMIIYMIGRHPQGTCNWFTILHQSSLGSNSNIVARMINLIMQPYVVAAALVVGKVVALYSQTLIQSYDPWQGTT